MAFDLESYLGQQRDRVENYLSGIFKNHAAPDPLVKAMTYSLEAGGKRLRPILCIAAFEAAGGSGDSILSTAAALECIHTYSLIHDDLPAMDDDDLRRGKPTNHKVFGEAIAILAGDGLLSEAFSLLSSAGGSLNAEAKLAIIRRIADAAGTAGMVGGQVLDIELESSHADVKALKEVHTCKTGRLLTVAVEAGALAAGIQESELKPFTDYGYHLGYAFQIVDDVLDVIGGAEIGKSQQSDIKQGKATFASLLGVDASKKLAEEEIECAIKNLKPFSSKAEPLEALAKYVISRSW